MPIIDEILRRAKEDGASDVHLTAGVPPRMRINGSLFTMNFPKLQPSDTMEIMLNILSEIQRDRFEEQGEFDMSFSVPGYGRCRVNIFKQRGSVSMAFRLVDSEIPSQKELGVPEVVRDLYQKHKGLILVTGAAGSGKSTALAAIVDNINHSRDAHIITLEDPIEYLHQHDRSIVNQREIGIDSASYAGALRAALREDPDVILIGELQEFETISLAVTAAETGRLVLSSMHTLDAANTVDRIVNIFTPHFQQQVRVQLASVLEAVVSQQLLPRADGSGRVVAYEIMLATPEIRRLIRENKSHQLREAIQANEKLGMTTMDASIQKLFRDNIITRETAIRYSLDPDGMQKSL